MTDRPTAGNDPARTRKPRLRRPGYFQCRRILDRLRRFQDLVRHDQRWGSEIAHARPLEQLLPPETKPEHRGTEIDRQIRRLIPLVVRDLKRAGIPTRSTWRIPEERYDHDKRRMVEKVETLTYHLVGDYFILPRDGYATSFTAVIGALDEGIGAYEELKRRGFWELFNPLAWIAHLLYAPTWVLERAGLIDPDEPGSPVLVGYAWLLRVILLIVFALILRKLGLVDVLQLIVGRG